MNLWKGRPVLETDALLPQLEAEARTALRVGGLTPARVIAAAGKLRDGLDAGALLSRLQAEGLSQAAAQWHLDRAKAGLAPERLRQRLRAELGERPFDWTPVSGGRERYAPLGVLLHVAAGNASGLPAMSVLEGLLAGNVNLLKLPSQQGGLSLWLLERLAQIDPALGPYLYAFDLPSADQEGLRRLLRMADAAAVWGGDSAISGIRALAPPSLPLIEWGHRLSFALLTPEGVTEQALDGLAQEVCLTEQLLCSSPQCVFLLTEDPAQLEAFIPRLAQAMDRACTRIPLPPLDLAAQAHISLTRHLAALEQSLGQRRLVLDPQRRFALFVDPEPSLTPGPAHRNLPVSALPPQRLADLLASAKGYLQTVGLACAPGQREALVQTLTLAGVLRVTRLSRMSDPSILEPHDGQYALRRYTRCLHVDA